VNAAACIQYSAMVLGATGALATGFVAGFTVTGLAVVAVEVEGLAATGFVVVAAGCAVEEAGT